MYTNLVLLLTVACNAICTWGFKRQAMRVSLLGCLVRAALLAVCKDLHHFPGALPGSIYPYNHYLYKV